jgi:1,4-dihydroxy-2-naphthoate octaprenyltransferase
MSAHVGIKDWISAFRLRTLPLAFSCIVAGLAAGPFHADIPWNLFLLALLTTLLLQILSNLANDLGDFQHGTDNTGRIGPSRAVQSGKISPGAMKKAIIITTLLALTAGIYLLFVAFGGNFNAKYLLFLVFGLSAIAAAIKYTAGKNPYGYSGLGDVSVLLFFGILGVAGSNFLFYQQLDVDVLWPALSIGCFSSGVLNLNNMRDIDNDRKSGKITLAVRLGSAGAKKYHFILIIVGWISIIYWTISRAESITSFLSLITLILFVAHLWRISNYKEPQQFDPELKKLAISTFLFSVSLLLGNMLI